MKGMTIISCDLELQAKRKNDLLPIIDGLKKCGISFEIHEKGSPIPGRARLSYKSNLIIVSIFEFKSRLNQWPQNGSTRSLPRRRPLDFVREADRIKRSLSICIYSDSAQGYWSLTHAEIDKLQESIGDFDIRLSYFSNGKVLK